MAELPTLTDPRDILARYEAALANDQLTQGRWRDTAEDGRWLACALGVIGDKVSSPRDCPASVMPRWLAQMVPAFFDGQKPDDAKNWGLRFYKALADCGGSVPFAAVYYWHAHTVCPLGIENSQKRKHDDAPHKDLQAMHLRALAGEKIAEDEWRSVLKNADAYAYAYAYADADAYANAYAYAYANADAKVWKRLADGMVDAINATANIGE